MSETMVPFQSIQNSKGMEISRSPLGMNVKD